MQAGWAADIARGQLNSGDLFFLFGTSDAGDPDHRAASPGPSTTNAACRRSTRHWPATLDKVGGSGFWLHQLSVGGAGQPGLTTHLQAQFQALRLFSAS